MLGLLGALISAGASPSEPRADAHDLRRVEHPRTTTAPPPTLEPELVPPTPATDARPAPHPTEAPTSSEPRTDPLPTPAIGSNRGDSLTAQASAWVAERLGRLGAWAPVLLVLLLVLANVLCVPGAFLTLAGGALFGFGWGLLCAWLGALGGAAAAFLIARHALRDRVRARLSRYPRLGAIEEAVTEEGWKVVFLTRLAPGSPFFLLNYLFGLTRVRFLPYLVATAIGMLPGTTLLVYLGALGQFAISGNETSLWGWAVRGLGLAALVAVVILVSRGARGALDRRLGARPPRSTGPNP